MGWVKGRSLRKKGHFLTFLKLKKKVPTAIKLDGGGSKAIMARPLKKRTIFAASQMKKEKQVFCFKF